MKNLIIIVSVIAMIFPEVHAQNNVVSGPIGSSIDEYLSKTVPYGFSGAVLVARNGEELLNKGYGYAHRDKKIENTPSSVFSTGSVTKQFTAAATMKLEMIGKINTDDKLGKYFPTLPKDKEEVTLYHLLTHTSGLPLALSGDDFSLISREEYLKKSLNAELEFEPGTAFNYSNVGYILLAMIIEDQSGLNYEAFLQKHLFGPARMTQTGYRIPDWSRKNFVHIYKGSKDNCTTEKFTKPTWHLIGNGGILSTTGDMHKWLLALDGDSILSKSAKAKMFTPFKNDYGFGWDVLDDGALRQHNGGSSLGNGAELRWFVEDGLFTMIFTNSTINGKIGFQVVRNELEALIMGDKVPLPPEISTVEKNLSTLIGTYELSSGEIFRIEGKEGSADLNVASQELLDLLMDPANYKKGGSNVGLNRKFESAFSKALTNQDFSGFDFTGASDDLKTEIKNELQMEGIDNPYFKVIRTMPSQRNENLKITKVALNADKEFNGESLILSIVSDQEKYAGLGVDFGFVSPISLGIFPTGGDSYQLYDLQSKMGAKLKIMKNDNDTYTFSVDGNDVKGIKKVK